MIKITTDSFGMHYRDGKPLGYQSLEMCQKQEEAKDAEANSETNPILAREAIATAAGIAQAAKRGLLSYDAAKAQCRPLLAIANARAAEIARKHGMRPRQITFTSLAR